MNYTAILAAIFTAKLGDWGPIYSNVDPSREWTGGTTIEFTQTDATTETYISGESRRRVALAVAVRAETQEEAADIGRGVRRILYEALTEIKNNEDVEGWTLEDEGTTADVRGVTVGESFYWYQNFTITEKKKGLI